MLSSILYLSFGIVNAGSFSESPWDRSRQSTFRRLLPRLRTLTMRSKMELHHDGREGAGKGSTWRPMVVGQPTCYTPAHRPSADGSFVDEVSQPRRERIHHHYSLVQYLNRSLGSKGHHALYFGCGPLVWEKIRDSCHQELISGRTIFSMQHSSEEAFRQTYMYIVIPRIFAGNPSLKIWSRSACRS